MRLLRWADAVNGYVTLVQGPTVESVPDTSAELNNLLSDFRAVASVVYHGYLVQNNLEALESYPNSVKRFLEVVDIGKPPAGDDYLRTVDLGEHMLRCQELLKQIQELLA